MNWCNDSVLQKLINFENSTAKNILKRSMYAFDVKLSKLIMLAKSDGLILKHATFIFKYAKSWFPVHAIFILPVLVILM